MLFSYHTPWHALCSASETGLEIIENQTEAPAMMNRPEKRKFRRLPITLDLSYRKVGSAKEQFHKGYTINVSPGGLYFETTEEALTPSDLLKVEFLIPPTEGLLEFGGRISGFGKVLRTIRVGSSGKYRTALEFCRPPKLCS